MRKKIFFIILATSLYSCAENDKLKEVFSKEYPSEKNINKDDIDYDLTDGYYFVKLKSDKTFNLVCNKELFMQKGCIDTWGISKSELMELNSPINKLYLDGYEISLISKEKEDSYLVRVTKNKVYFKDILFEHSDTGFRVRSEKKW